MVNEILKSKVDLILNEERRAYASNGRWRGGLGSFNIDIGDGWVVEGDIPQLLSVPADPNAIRSANADTALTLYSSLKPEERSEYKNILLSYLSRGSVFSDVAYLIFFLLHRAGETKVAISQSILNLKGDSAQGFSNVLAMLAKIISYEYSYISKQTYDQIKASLKGESDFRLQEKINAAELELLKLSLVDINPEINKDKEKVMDIWGSRFNSSEIPILINEIEENFVAGDFTDIKFATSIGRVRVLLVEALKGIAIEISINKGDGKINNETDEHAVFEYLKTQSVINNEERQLIKSLHKMTSDKGAHRITAFKEYARISKNMVYEVILLIFSNYERSLSDIEAISGSDS